MIQAFFDFPVYFKSFIGLFAPVNPVGVIPVFISMISYQTAAVRGETNLTANLSVAIILWVPLFLGDTILQFSGTPIDSFRIAGGVPVVTVAMSMISGKLGGDRQSRQEKSETVVRESIGVVPLALPLMAGPRVISSTIVWDTRYHSISYLLGFLVTIALFTLCCRGLFRMVLWLVRVLRQIGINAITRITELLLMASRIEFIVTSTKGIFSSLLS